MWDLKGDNMRTCFFVLAVVYVLLLAGCANNVPEYHTEYTITSTDVVYEEQSTNSMPVQDLVYSPTPKPNPNPEQASVPKEPLTPSLDTTSPQNSTQEYEYENPESEEYKLIKYTTTPGGNATTDKIFLLSIEEVLRYFGDSGMVRQGAAIGEEVRIANQPRTMNSIGVHYWGVSDRYNWKRSTLERERHIQGVERWTASWWLRSPGRTSNRAAFITSNGMLNIEGEFVLPAIRTWRLGVRPALWLCLQFEPSEATEPQTTDERIHVSVGDIIPFGNYYWSVLVVQYTQALIITDHVIIERNFHERREAVTWETSDIRKYLNGVFLNTFSQTEQERIIETEVINNDNPWTWMAPVYVDAAIPGPNTAAGDIVRFGSHDWRVLAVDGSKALIITENIVGVRHFHTEREHVTWETSEIRRYLNKTFYYTFPETDRSRIMETSLRNPDNPWDFSDSRGHMATPGGNDTIDKIFLLSIEEVVQYFGDSGLVGIGATMGAYGRSAYLHPGLLGPWVRDHYNSARTARDADGIVHNWWLRSPGSRPNKAAFVNSFGFLHICGMYVLMSWEAHYGVRPALWLSLEK